MRATRFAGHEVPEHIQIASVLYDFATDGGGVASGGEGDPGGTIVLPGEVPAGALVIGGLIDVEESLASDADAASVGVQLLAADDIADSVATGAGGGNEWDAGFRSINPADATPGTWIETTEPSRVTVVVADEALTAGRMWIHLFYIMLPSTAEALS